MRRLQHPNIIAMLDAFETRSDFCVVTEFAQGKRRVGARGLGLVHGGLSQAAVRLPPTPHPTRTHAAGELFQILEDDQRLPESVVRGIAKQARALPARPLLLLLLLVPLLLDRPHPRW